MKGAGRLRLLIRRAKTPGGSAIPNYDLSKAGYAVRTISLPLGYPPP
jgi:hypothetical protein